MNMLTRVFSYLHISRGSDRKKRLYVIDAIGLVNVRQRTQHQAPRASENFFILKTIAEFALKEDIQIAIVFLGRPLREASEGSTFKGVRVYYAKDSDLRRKKILSLLRKNGHKYNVLLLTSDLAIERTAMTSGISCMRISTFKRILEAKQHKEQHVSSYRNAGKSQSATSSGSQDKASSTTEKSGIRQLIDPV